MNTRAAYGHLADSRYDRVHDARDLLVVEVVVHR